MPSWSFIINQDIRSTFWMVDWTSLPPDVLALISQKIEILKDYIVFGKVCKSWRSIILTSKQKGPSSPPEFPWLILSEKRKTNPKRCFFSLASYKVYKLPFPEALGRKCLGVGFGWLLTLGADLEINLLRASLLKAVLSSNPWKNGEQDKDCIVMVINGEFRELAFARLGDKAWTNVKVPSRVYQDIAYYKNQFYAVDCHGVVVRCDLDNDEGPRATVTAPPPDETKDWIQKYLVESMGDLLLVSRVRGGHYYEELGHKKRYYTASFSILKMEKRVVHDQERSNYATYEYCWVPVKDLGDRAWFLGFNASISLSVSDFSGCFEANCIYFTDDDVVYYLGSPGGGYDMGIFNMTDGTIKRHFKGRSLSRISPPFWYI